MKRRFRASIYVDIDARTQDEAEKIGRRIADFLSFPEDRKAPLGYYNPYFGGAGEQIAGDLLGNVERTKHI